MFKRGDLVVYAPDKVGVVTVDEPLPVTDQGTKTLVWAGFTILPLDEFGLHWSSANPTRYVPEGCIELTPEVKGALTLQALHMPQVNLGPVNGVTKPVEVNGPVTYQVPANPPANTLVFSQAQDKEVVLTSNPWTKPVDNTTLDLQLDGAISITGNPVYGESVDNRCSNFFDGGAHAPNKPGV